MIIDFEGYHVGGKGFLAREFGYIGINWSQAGGIRFDLRPYINRVKQKDWRTIRYVERNISGLPFLSSSSEHVCSMENLNQMIVALHYMTKTPLANVVAYKGGNVEKQHLDALGIPSVNLEGFGCPKYNSMRNAHYESITCGHHSQNSLHCAQAEVTAFRDWVLTAMM